MTAGKRDPFERPKSLDDLTRDPRERDMSKEVLNDMLKAINKRQRQDK